LYKDKCKEEEDIKSKKLSPIRNLNTITNSNKKNQQGMITKYQPRSHLNVNNAQKNTLTTETYSDNKSSSNLNDS